MELSVGTSLIVYEDNPAILCVVSDITKRKQMEERLKEANEILARSSRIDGLTSIPNRRYYDEVFQKEWDRVKRSSGSIALLMIDIDHFKNFNDTYGHLEGDKCLKVVAQTLQSSIVRSTDFLARYGGEEFSLILPETDLDGAVKVAEKLRRKIEELLIENLYSSDKRTLTVSVGVSSMTPEKDDHYDELIKRADKALYKAKNNGRNIVEVF